MSSASPLTPTYQGYIGSTQDALILFEGCLCGRLNHVARRPHDRERANLIRSGNVFIYEEHSSGIKRWTDGIPWSPSRILGNFLVYRELERPFPPGEKKRAMKRTSRRSPGVSKHDSFSTSSSMSSGYNQAATVTTTLEGSSSMSKETERSLIGSLVDSYGFKDEGLVKKTVSVTVGNVSHHLVSYYNVADVLSGRLSAPSKDPRFAQIQPRSDLISRQNFRTPIDEVDAPERLDDRGAYGAAFTYPRNAYDITNQSIGHRQMALPAPQTGFASAPGMYQQHYNMHSGSTGFDSMAPPHPAPSFGGQYASQNMSFPQIGMKQDPYSAQPYRTSSSQPQPPQHPRYNSIDGISTDSARPGMPPVGSLLARRASAYEGPMESPLGPATSGAIESKIPADGSYPNSQTYFGLREDDQSQQHQHLRALPNPGQSTGFDRPPSASTYPINNHQDQRDGSWYGAASSSQPTYMSSQPTWHSGQS